MLNKLYIHVIALLGLFFFAACGDEETGVKWGDSKYYDDFLFCKYTPDTLTRTIAFEFNDDAKELITEPIQIRICKKVDSIHYKMVDTSELRIVVDGKLCKANIITVDVKKDSLQVGLVFNRNAENKMHYYYLQVAGDCGLDRINNLEAADFNNASAVLEELRVEKVKRMNPLSMGVIIVCILFIVFVLLCRLINSNKYKHFGSSLLEIDYGSEFNSVSLSNVRAVILTANEKEKQSLWSRVVKGKIRYEHNEFWISPVEIRCPKSDEIWFSPQNMEAYSLNTMDIVPGQDFMVKQAENNDKTVKLTLN